MNQSTMFSSGLELANLLLGSDLLHHSWAAIEEFYRETPSDDPTSPLSVEYKIHQQSPIGTIISFISSPPCTAQYLQEEGRDLLVSSEQLMRENFTVFQFVSTKVNPTFSLLRAAVTLFSSLQDQLSFLRTQYGNTRPLIVTGHSIGGCIATLFTLWLLEAISPKDTKRPLCITFGSPLIGDTGLQQAISERPTWNSCFLHVSSSKDPIQKLFAASPQNGRPIELGYKPFGTFLLCSESGFACFEEPELALDLMVAISSDGVGNGGPLQSFCYGEILKIFKCGLICRGVSKVGGRDLSPLQTGLFIQAEGIDVKATQLQQQLKNGDIDSLVAKMEKITKDVVARKRNVFDPTKKLNEMKINMTYLEWYKKHSLPRGGYYDVFKSKESMAREEIVKRKRILTQYWVKMVKEAEKMPQEGGKFFLLKWLYGGTNYRRMVEPLDIAEFYKKGNKDYLAQRSDHYKLLEKWVDDDKSNGNQSNEERNHACSLTEDSCFWAYVEEAMISCKLLRNGETSPEVKESQRENLVKFENYVMDLVRKYAVSTEIFLRQSSFMQWWEDYKQIKGASYHSSLTDFMSNCKYKQYA